MADFVHLHVHTEYSLLDGLPKIKKLIGRVKELEMSAVALTDHGVMYGAVEFFKECKAQGIKPIIGMEGYIVSGDHLKKEDRDINHLVLLAKDLSGYKNLMVLSTIAHLEGYYYRPRFSKELLKKHHEGLIALASCHQGELGQLLISHQYEKAKEVANWYQEVMGEGNYYIEIQRHQPGDFVKQAANATIADHLQEMQKEEEIWVKEAVRLSRDVGIPLVATNDVHYLKQSDAVAQDVLVCVGTGKNVTELDRLRYVDMPTLFLRSEAEMQDIFPDIQDALENTKIIADKINIEIELGKWLFPNFVIPDEKKASDYLKELCRERVSSRFELMNEEVKKRLDYELDVIIQKGYAPYFLMMADIVNWCNGQGIITNTRGSAAGSVVSYVLGITTVDPIKYALPFERFLNPFRPKPPDIDLDIADDRREELIAFIVEKYGQDKVAQICTFGRMLARAAVRDVGRALGHPYSFPDKIAKLIPLGYQGFPMTINHALEITPELKQMYDSDPQAKKLLDLAREIEGNARHSSVHAAGVVVSPEKMTNYCPLQLEPKGKKIITQYEMHACEDIGLVKFDVLGIRNLSILGAARDIVENERKIKIDLDHLPSDDKKTFEMLARGETMGVFQLGGTGMTKWLRELKPNRIEDIMVMIALFRPGPMANIPEFIARKNKTKQVKYMHPKMKDFLDKSYGILVYQEDILFTALSLAGYNWETVDKLRLAIGKKIPEEMAKQHEIFVEGARNTSGLTKEEAEKIWDLFVPFQGYGFNKAHAASYGIVSYQTAYLKAHYPVEYMTALLTAESNDTEKVAQGVDESKRMKIIVLPPDINFSESNFTIEKNEKSVEGRAIRFGLSAIKNVGDAAIRTILEARNGKGTFASLTDLCRKVDGQKVNKKVLESLIKVGALDRYGKRAALLASLEEIRAKANGGKKKDDGQDSLFGEEASNELSPIDHLQDVEEFKKAELLSLEKNLLGFYLTEHPLAPILASLSHFRTHRIFDLLAAEDKENNIKVGGIISDMRVVVTKTKGEEMAFIKVEDDSGSIEMVVFPKVFSQSRQYLVKDQVVIVKGKLEIRDEAKSIIVENVSPFDPNAVQDKLQQEVVDVEFMIPAGTSPKVLVELNSLLRQNQGEMKVALIFIDNRGNTKRMILPYGVNLSSNVREHIDKLLYG